MTTIPLAYEDFLVSMKQELLGYLGEDYQVELKHVIKNNGIILDGLLIRGHGENVSPTIYLNTYYEQFCEGRDFRDIAEEILAIYEDSSDESREIGLNFKYEFEQMKSMITYRIVNYEKNKLLLRSIPHLRILDLAVTFHCIVKLEKAGIGSIRITEEHRTTWNVSLEQLWEVAVENTKRLFPPVIRPMEEVVLDLIEQKNLLDEEESKAIGKECASKSNMYVLTNQKGINGAACLLYPHVLEEFAQMLGEDFYILPSSIHELILVPQTFTNQEHIQRSKVELENMVQEINETQVAVEEVLSDHVYEYSKIKDVIA
ncbi:MAG: DUF5688 family protein [Clostridiales bacterium]|nr:DUF5688 family protein [Clostridiales bacterium]